MSSIESGVIAVAALLVVLPGVVLTIMSFVLSAKLTRIIDVLEKTARRLGSPALSV